MVSIDTIVPHRCCFPSHVTDRNEIDGEWDGGSEGPELGAAAGVFLRTIALVLVDASVTE